MASNFTNFLVTLGQDPQQLEAFKQNPHAVMDAAGLTPAEKTLLMSGNAQLIRSALVSDPGHKDAMGIPPDQSLPAKMPMCVFMVPQPGPPPPPPTAGPTGNIGGQDATQGSQSGSSASKGA